MVTGYEALEKKSLKMAADWRKLAAALEKVK
jgi:hypothetical protein